tara:strand:+ start:1414 stop:1530 length:117 start_codon:yes stop_codon:yes gene_type:complete
MSKNWLQNLKKKLQTVEAVNKGVVAVRRAKKNIKKKKK